ncbi:MAG: stage II sporulation protein P [Clostridia bacterium]|nr:stage II sporulation protein P [Clostridia bacterium]
MSNTPSVLRIALLFVCVISLFSYGIYRAFFKIEVNRSTIKYSDPFVHFSFENNESNRQSDENTLFNKTEEIKSAAVPTAAGDVLGRIKNKTIKSDGLNVSSGGVHIKNSTDLSIDVNSLLSSEPTFKIKKSTKAQVLIVHTHATESFLKEDRDYYTDEDSSRTTDNSFNVTELGSIIAQKLNAASIATLHDRTQHDYPSYNGSYSRAASTIKKYLENNTGIKTVIDIHRDAIQTDNTKTKLTTEIGGKPAAQVMLVMGSNSGNIKNFPDWQENLKLALRLQKNIESMYPNLARPLSLVSRCYNENLTTGSMLIEIGTDANSFDEVKYSAELLSDAIIKTLEDL